MTEFVLTEETAQTPIGALLGGAADPEICIRDESGRVLAVLLVSTQSDDASQRAALELTADEMQEIRRRRHADRAGDMTTAELLERVQSQDRE